MRHQLLGLLGLILIGHSGTAQSLFIAPRRTSAGWIEVLTRQHEPPPTSTETTTRFCLMGATNVHPLLSNPPTTTDFPNQSGYFVGITRYFVQTDWGNWRLSYGWELAEHYEGNSGAVRLYLEANQGGLTSTTVYPVRATLNRSAISRLALDYTERISLGTVQIVYSVGLQGALLQRVQQGTLIGQKQGDQFTGQLQFASTRDIPPAQREGYHIGLDATLIVHTAEGWTLGIAVENLVGASQVRRIQHIDAEIAVNQFEPDSEGFLRGVPLLEGAVSTRRLQRTPEPYLHFGLIAPSDHSTRPALISERIDRWRWGFALVDTSGWWTIVWANQPALQIGYHQSNWQFTLGLDHYNPNKARFLAVEMGIGL